MGHLLSTTNASAASRAGERVKFPDIASLVVFRPRMGEFRSGRSRFPALVLKSDPDNQLLDLLVIYDADDMHSLKGVPRIVGEDRGWDYKNGAGGVPESVMFNLAPAIDALKAQFEAALFGKFEPPEEPIVSILAEFEGRIAALERKAKAKPKRSKADVTTS